ncbi:MAG: hypothetical protein LBM77_14455 [Spirochaetaceae bacterium]|jgi:hypothetical protein|nr:hypothetical protein [Spirochaetaceae bacterium]
MKLDEYMKKYGLVWEFPHSCIFSVLSNGEETIYWVDLDGFRKDSFFITVDKTDEVTGKLSFTEFYRQIPDLLNSGWDKECSIGPDHITEWIEGFAENYNISLVKEFDMSYRKEQRTRAKGLLEDMFHDPGNGSFNGRNYKFILKNPKENLWSGICEDAIKYFEDNNIPWWESDIHTPTGHLLSSQVACVNHLYPIRQRQDLATAMLKAIDKDIICAEKLDDGYVEFEIVGSQNYLHERQHTRGANATSIDAVMLGRKAKKNVLFLIEWKYTENYNSDCMYIKPRWEIYNPLLEENDCPINSSIVMIGAANPFKALYYEPFYQLMRQTLLGWKMVESNEYGADEYIHLHIVPDENKEMLGVITSKELSEIASQNNLKTMEEIWKYVLKEPKRYIRISPKKFLDPIRNELDTVSFMQYINKRYWCI